MEIMMKYAFHKISLEAFSMENAADQDVIYDGYNST